MMFIHNDGTMSNQTVPGDGVLNKNSVSPVLYPCAWLVKRAIPERKITCKPLVVEAPYPISVCFDVFLLVFANPSETR